MSNLEDKINKWYYNPIAVLLIIFLFAGPFGLPLVYKSPHFNKTWKIIMTVATVLFTAFMIWSTVHLVQKMWDWIDLALSTAI